MLKFQIGPIFRASPPDGPVEASKKIICRLGQMSVLDVN